MYLYKLDFQSPVRFGKDDYTPGLSSSDFICHSDTLFSAISLEFIKIYGEAEYSDFLIFAQSDKFQLTGLLPYLYDDLFIPKPIMLSTNKKHDIDGTYVSKTKKLKKLRFINVNDFDIYVSNLKNGKLDEYDMPIFAVEDIETRVAVIRDGDSLPYYVSSFTFEPGCGLYFILDCNNDDMLAKLENVIESLSYEGIGGKRSSGKGKFSYTQKHLGEGDDIFNLINRKSEKYMLLSILYPSSEEIKKIKKEDTYQIINRRGFIYSTNYSDEVIKKSDLHVLNEGSCLSDKYKGKIIDVSTHGNHPVYKYAKGFYIGV